MPLLINGKPVVSLPENVSSYISDMVQYQEAAKKLTSTAERVIGPKDLLYVDQREFAATIPGDKHVSVLGTEDATTCHIVVLRHTGSGSTALAHCDGKGTEDGVSRIISRVLKLNESLGSPEGRLELHMIGGFLDQRGESKQLTQEVLSAFHSSDSMIHLVSACCTGLNDTIKNGIHFPVIYGVAVDVQSGEISPATFPEKGPDINIRSATNFVGSKKMNDIYQVDNGHLIIEPVQWHEWPNIDAWLACDDQFIRKHLSTSPDQEKPSFAAHVRSALTVIKNNPDPGRTLFPDHKPRIYTKDKSTGQWISV